MPSILDLERLVRGVGLRVTRPRVAVPRAVYGHPHTGTESIIGAVRRNLPELSHQAGYDSLHALAAAGLVRRPAGSLARYEARVADNHHHVVCRSCGLIADVDCAAGEPPCLDPATLPSGLTVDEAEVIYRGVCPGCSTTNGP